MNGLPKRGSRVAALWGPLCLQGRGQACRVRTPSCPWVCVIWGPVLCSARVVAVRWDWQSVALCAAVHPFVPLLRKGGEGAGSAEPFPASLYSLC